jgi:cytochrome c oxidase assembly protein subunit 11
VSSAAPNPDLGRKNARTALLAALLVAAMVGLAFASVPLYRLFCQVTGFAGTTMRVDETAAAFVARPVPGQSVSVRFDANTSNALPWQFQPTEAHRTVQIGARNMTVYTARNMSDRAVTGTATFNVTPTQAGRYFSKIQCFCFTEQTLQPGQTVQMPVVFFVDPAILNDPDARDISEITLSYTFYPVEQPGSGS